MAKHTYYRSYDFDSNATDKNEIVLQARAQYKRELADGKEDSRFLKDGLFRDKADFQPKTKDHWLIRLIRAFGQHLVTKPEQESKYKRKA